MKIDTEHLHYWMNAIRQSNRMRDLADKLDYTSGEESFDDSITDISATKIRKDLGLK